MPIQEGISKTISLIASEDGIYLDCEIVLDFV